MSSELTSPVTGVLKGYDQLMNLVMDEVVESYESELGGLRVVL
jgi:small nuclear ribonucleoprotein (snRNP)-like protein